MKVQEVSLCVTLVHGDDCRFDPEEGVTAEVGAGPKPTLRFLCADCGECIIFGISPGLETDDARR